MNIPSITKFLSQAPDANKVSVLKAIEERKNVLFGQFTSKLMKPEKNTAWNEISELAKQLSVMKQDKSAQYFRDVVWQNWRRTALVIF